MRIHYEDTTWWFEYFVKNGNTDAQVVFNLTGDTLASALEQVPSVSFVCGCGNNGSHICRAS